MLEKTNYTCFKKKVTFGRNFRGWNWKTEIENEKKDICRYMIITNKTSTKRVRKHKENKRLIVPVPFQLPRSTWKSRWHSSIIKERSPATPNSETNAHINVLNSQYPNTRTNVALISWENLIWQRIMISNENVINLAISHEI